MHSILAPVLLIIGSAWGQQQQTYSFNGANGAGPSGGLLADANGNLYGVTAVGGSGSCTNGVQNGCGVVYEMQPSAHGRWSEVVLYNFAGGNDGASPNGSLILDQAGSLYGVTSAGGPLNQGTVFELSPPEQPGNSWTETILYAFAGNLDGAVPQGALVMDAGGNLYGTTTQGGSIDAGTVFELSPPMSHGGVWSETIIHSLTGRMGDGALPTGPLVFDATGNLYCTANGSGPNDGGTAFELSPPAQSGEPWTSTVLYAFFAPYLKTGDSAWPYGGVVFGAKGALFGTAQSGGVNGFGTVFRLAPPAQSGAPWTEEILHGFLGGALDGEDPIAGIIFTNSSTIFGTTPYGGGDSGGTVFRLEESDGQIGYSVYTFENFLKGANPTGGVISHKGALYGATGSGGANAAGTVFRLSR